MFFPSFSFALSFGPPPPSRPPQSILPYKVIGDNCVKGENCKLLKEGEYAGYYLKSNIPFNDPRFKKIRHNMVTKAVLKKEKGKLNNEIVGLNNQVKNLKEVAESCTGEVCTAKYDSKGCNVCALNVDHSDPKSSYNVYYLCTMKGCIGSPEEMAKLYARSGMCVKYGPSPLAPPNVYDLPIIPSPIVIDSGDSIPFPKSWNGEDDGVPMEVSNELIEGGGSIQ